MKRISIQDLKARLSSAVAEAQSGSTIVITRHNEPVAQFMPCSPPAGPSRQGCRNRAPRAGGEARNEGPVSGRLDGRPGRALSPEPDAPGRRRLYLDTSAYLCILLGEEDSERLTDETAGAELLSSVLLVLEARRSLIRLAREGTLKPEHYKTCMDRIAKDTTFFVLRDLTLDLCDSNIVPAVATPRSLDLAHLRTALWFDGLEHIQRFVTMEGSQEQAAKELGLPV